MDPEFATTLIERQLLHAYPSANYFGPRPSLASAMQQVRTVCLLLRASGGAVRHRVLGVASRTAEFVGWLHQDLGDFRTAGYWSDRSMEWAQEAADDPMQAYVLFRKSHQAAAQNVPEKTIGLARAAQRTPGVPSRLTALATQQEATGYALQRNPKAALQRFDDAHELAHHSATEISTFPTPSEASKSAVDTTYCTPGYIELQRAKCWLTLGEPHRAVQIYEREIEALPPVYRNDRGVYLAQLALALAETGDPEQGAQAAVEATTIAAHTGSARILTALEAAAATMLPRRDVPAVMHFIEQFHAVRSRSVAHRP
ncbi:hypothetical protein [Streptomyces sp. NPDC003077]|uniref:hypothetical protein n=1 Tax=Streptomyces sp. NPDC003077 TaxID=3154443 RepID=UPI0033B27305